LETLKNDQWSSKKTKKGRKTWAEVKAKKEIVRSVADIHDKLDVAFNVEMGVGELEPATQVGTNRCLFRKKLLCSFSLSYSQWTIEEDDQHMHHYEDSFYGKEHVNYVGEGIYNSSHSLTHSLTRCR
jgi:hypothetical protein